MNENLAPVDDEQGWFVVNTLDAEWKTGTFGAYTRFETEPRFASVGINVSVLEPGQVSCMYHGEDEQEDFLVLAGECLLLIEEQERPLKQWDFVHCPAWTRHVFVGAGEGPCTLLSVGTRTDGDVIYPVSALARKHGAGVRAQTSLPTEAYAGVPDDAPIKPDPRWLPGA